MSPLLRRIEQRVADRPDAPILPIHIARYRRELERRRARLRRVRDVLCVVALGALALAGGVLGAAIGLVIAGWIS